MKGPTQEEMHRLVDEKLREIRDGISFQRISGGRVYNHTALKYFGLQMNNEFTGFEAISTALAVFSSLDAKDKLLLPAETDKPQRRQTDSADGRESGEDGRQ